MLYVLFLLCFRVHLFINALWSSAGILGQLWCLIVSIPDLCPFSYFKMSELMVYMHMCLINAHADVS